MKQLNLLIVEDSKDDAASLLRHLFNAGYDVQSEIVQTAADMQTALAEGDWDIILSDYSVPHFSGLEALSVLEQSGLDIPFIVISGPIGESVAVEAMVCGVDDYLMKDNLARLAPAIERELENAARRRKQKQAEESLRRSEESKHFLASIVESSKDSIISVSLDGIVTSWNKAAEYIYGYSAVEAVGKPLTMLTLPEDLKEVLANIDKIKHNLQVEMFVTERICKDGHHIFLEVTLSPIKNDGGKIIGVSTLSRDISERKRADEALYRSEENLANAQRIAHLGSWEMDLVTNQIFWSSEVYRIFGVSKDNFEVTLEAFFGFIHPEDMQSVKDAADAALSQNVPYNIEHRIITQAGEERIVCAIGEVASDESGKPFRFTGTVQDVTQRKRAELALENAVKRERAMIENLLDVICTIDAEGRYVSVSPASLKIWGYLPEELVGESYIEMVVPEDVAKTNEAAAEVMSGVAARDFENRYRHKNGSVVDIRWTAYWSDAEQLMFCIAHDITERKRAEEEKTLLTAHIEQQHERLDNILANVPGVVWEARGKPDAATQRIEFVSDYVETMLGYTVEEWITTPNFWLTIVHPEDKERIAREATERFVTGSGYTRQFRWVAKDGRIVWVEAQATVIHDEFGQPIGLRGINIDITERKRLEDQRVKLMAELDYEKARLQHILDNSPSFIVALRGPDYVFEMVNPAYYRLVGQRNLIGLPAREALPELVSQGYVEMVNGVYNTGEPFIGNEVPVQLQSVDGKTLESRYVNFVYMPMRESDGTISGILSYGVDVTEQVLSRIKVQESMRKQMELAAQLETERARLVAAQSVAKVGSWETDLVTLEVNWSAETFRIFELDPNQFQPDHRGFLQFVHPEDRAALDDAFAKSFDQHSVCSFEHRILLADGGIKFIEERWEILRDEQGKPLKSMGTCQDITERMRVEKELKASETELRALFAAMTDVILVLDAEGRYQKIAPTDPAYLYKPPAGLLGKRMDEVLPEEDVAFFLEHIRRALDEGQMHRVEYSLQISGTEVWFQGSVSPLSADSVIWIARDVSQVKQAEKALEQSEEQLRQSQKLEAVGRLAGGIAHDFNNMLTAINGYSELTLRRLEPDSPLRQNIEEIKKAGERSAELTYQLLAFSRQQILQPKILSLNQAITDTSKMLGRLIGEDIQLITVLNQNAGQVKVDPGQLSQIIMNLAVNARDAMPPGGRLTIETDNVTLDEEYARHHVSTIPGDYVMMSVSDTGTGISAESMKHLFEPFFTTKEVGQGTGLGLATVYGIVKQSGGNIWVYSEVGVGTTFKIYLPRVMEKAEEAKAEGTFDELPRGTETVLLVEDEEMVRSLTRQILEDCGYTVLEAQNGVEALSICEEHDCQLDLVMTDVVMPQMGGRELAEKFARIYPKMQILFTSGYTDDAVVRHGVIEAGTNFIQKPFTPAGLALKVREVLDGANGS